MAKKYIFVAGGDACGACAALDGTISDAPLGPQHPNCQCQSEPVDEEKDCPTVDVSTPNVETTGATTTVGAEVTVTCCDGTTRGMSVEQDLGPMSPSIDLINESFLDFVNDVAAELVDEDCAEQGGGWVEEGEGEGVA
jgi:hypothetical protein